MSISNRKTNGDDMRRTEKLVERRLRLASHPEEIASNLILCQPTYGWLKPVRQATNFIDILQKDT